MNEKRLGCCYSPGNREDRYIPDGPTNYARMSGVARMLADSTHAGDLEIRSLGIATRKVWFTLDGYVFEVKASHKA